ncbi:MAG: rhodanese-like domain-containing protein [Deltaproteobacteria bacterium]|nr:rhodanese-like domain-containing protein [Deltaproteobacteria bacterium]
MLRKKGKHYLVFMVLACLSVISSPLLAGEGFRDADVKEAAEMVAKEKNNARFVILDVRTKGEYDKGHLFNSINIDIKSANFGEEIGLLDRNKTYLVYCHSGKRSKRAQKKMKSMGFKNIINMKGGFTGWLGEKNPYQR